MLVWILLVLAGLSESAGRMLPILARRHSASRGSVIGLVLLGAVVETLVFAVWPLTASTFAGLTVAGARPAAAWTVGSAAPLLLSGVLAVPLVGPNLHRAVLVLAGVGLAGVLAASGGLGWWPALGCVAGSGVVLAALLAAVRRSVGAWGSVPEPEWAL